MQCPCKGCSQDKRLALDESGKYTSCRKDCEPYRAWEAERDIRYGKSRIAREGEPDPKNAAECRRIMRGLHRGYRRGG